MERREDPTIIRQLFSITKDIFGSKIREYEDIVLVL